ncbi:SusC/RagA family TonB-linked outer membrane protein [Flavitalea flava]
MSCKKRSHLRLFVSLLLFSLPLLTLAQSGKITGQVRSKEDNKGLSGVSVAIAGSADGASGGTFTDVYGFFTINASPGARLIISSIGYETVEWKVAGSDTIHILLTSATRTMQDVVVIGYGTVKRKDLTGSVASIDTKNFSSIPVTNAGEAAQGKAAGVQVISSGAPGSNVTFRIRGAGTINNADPLIVIDGVPTDAPLNNINTNDIASFEVLKDASAGAIYGSRGANGVILITTKKGSNGQGHLSFNFFTGLQSAAKVVKMLNGSEFAKLNNEMLVNNNLSANPAYAKPDTLGTGTDWLGALFQTAPMQNYTLSYSGGSDKYNYYVSGGYFNQQGIVINTGYKRFTIQFNSEAKPLDWLRFGNNLTLTHDQKPSGAYNIRNAMAANPTQAIYNKDGTYAGPSGNPQWYGDVTNPIGQATIINNNIQGYNILGSVYGEATILPGLKFKTTGGVQAQFFDSLTWSPKYNWQPIPQPNAYLAQQYNKRLTWLWDNYFTYDRVIAADHHLTLLAGTSSQTNRYDYLSGNISSFASELTQQMNNGTLNPNTGGDASEWSLLSYMGRINYAYQDKYLLTATVRRDGSSRFGQNNKYGTFPSASAAWRISRERFFHADFVNDLKLRAGYGITGNQNIGNYSFAAVLQTAQYNFNGNIVSTVIPQVLPNPGVQWETVAQGNIGLDATLFKNRLTVTVDGYVKNTSNMLVPAVVPVTTGYSSTNVPFINAGKVRNTGVELTFSTKNMTGEFTWNTDINVSFNRNKIVSLNDTTPLYNGSIGLNYYLGINQAGHPVNELYGYVAQGIFQNQSEVDKHAVQQPGADTYNRTSPGDIRFTDLNNDGVIDAKDRTYLGNPNPTTIFSMNNSFAYRGFDLGIFIQGVAGNKLFNANNIFQEGMSVAQNQTERTLGRWEGEGTGNTMPRAIYNDPNQNTRPSTRFVENGSYLRIKNITLGYTLPRAILQKIKFSSIRLYASCQNLHTFTKYTGFDPEVSANGIDYSVYPVTRTVSVGVNLNL